MPVKKIILHSLAALLIFFILLIARMPAYVVMNQLPKHIPGFKVAGVTGTIWDARVSQMFVKVNGRPVFLNDVSWEVSPWSLFLLNLSGKLEANQGEQYVRTEFSAGIDYSLELVNLEAKLNVNDMKPFFRMMPESSGYVEILIAKAGIENNIVTELDGSFVVNKLKVMFGNEMNLGTFGAKLGLEDENILADISDIDATLGMDGEVTVYQKDRSFKIRVDLTTQETTPDMIQQNIKNFARPQPDGSFRFTFSSKF